ncbi:hypothetical protein Bbelb_064720 [Branchiostoma belcheri]|nr:hypothetical protein Bbelb_064720 [Branchiostoma belcheri]
MASRLALALLLGLVIAVLPGEARDDTGSGNSGELLGTESDKPALLDQEGDISRSKRTWTLPEARKCKEPSAVTSPAACGGARGISTLSPSASTIARAAAGGTTAGAGATACRSELFYGHPQALAGAEHGKY